jgi:GNAT superfamily N-acetyltransferase
VTGRPADVGIRRLGPEDVVVFNRLSETDNLFDEDPSGPPSGALTSDGGRAFLADPSVLFWVAEAGPLTVGFLHGIVQRRRTAGPWAEVLLMEMGVHADWRRQGVGTALVSAMEHWMAGNGVLEAWVPANTYAVGFYLKSGFLADEGAILVKQLH